MIHNKYYVSIIGVLPCVKGVVFRLSFIMGNTPPLYSVIYVPGE